MVLLSLAQDWAREVDGRVTALIVDHRLRADSTTEAEWVAAQARSMGVEAAILTRLGGPIATRIQATARDARYRLLLEWCSAHGVLHLMTAHHRDDQAETVSLRRAKASGEDGLAAMAPILEYAEARLLRPLLSVPKARLSVTRAARGLLAVQDPSNRNMAFDRVRIRKALAVSQDHEALVDTATEMALARKRRDGESADLLAQGCRLYPEGYALLDPAIWRSAPKDAGMRAVSMLISAIGGRRHPPRQVKLARFYEAFTEDTIGAGRTLGGCHIVPRRGNYLMLREHQQIDLSEELFAGGRWDGRFDLRFVTGLCRNCDMRRLGKTGVRQLNALVPRKSMDHVPPVVRPTLPAIWGLEGVCEVPHLSYSRCNGGRNDQIVREVRFAPIRPIQATRFTL